MDNPGTGSISERLIDALDAVLYLDKKQIVEAEGVRLHASEVHLLMCAVAGMGFTQIAGHFAISKGAVSQTVARLVDKGVVAIQKDKSRKNAAAVTLTPLGRSLHARIEALRGRLRADLDARLAGYSPAELVVVDRFVDDLRGFTRESLAAISLAREAGVS